MAHIAQYTFPVNMTKLVELPAPPASKPRVAAPVGNVLQAAHDLKHALQIAELAVDLAEHAGACRKSVETMRRQIRTLRG